MRKSKDIARIRSNHWGRVELHKPITPPFAKANLKRLPANH